MSGKGREVVPSNPMHNPTSFYSMTSVMNEIERGIFYRMESCLPGIIEKFDRERHIVAVRPLVKRVGFDGTEKELPVIWMTMQRLQVGGFLIDVPVHVGDVGWMIASDRNAENAKAKNNKIQEKDSCKLDSGRMNYGSGNQGPQAPGQYDMHSFLTGFFIPDSWAKIKIPDDYKDALLIQNLDRNGKATGRIYMTPDGGVGIESDEEGLKDSDADDMNGSGLKVKADVDMKGAVRIEKNKKKKSANQGGTLYVEKALGIGDNEQISISGEDIGGDRKANFREMRFATVKRNGRLQFQKAYILATSPDDDGNEDIGSDSGDVTQGIINDGGGEGIEYTVQSGSNSNITFSVEGGSEQSSLEVNSALAGKTVRLNVYYV